VSTIQWVSTGYTLALSVTIPVSSWAFERCLELVSVGDGSAAVSLLAATADEPTPYRSKSVRGERRVKSSQQTGPRPTPSPAGTVAEAAAADMVLLAPPWDKVPESVAGPTDWNGRIVIDATNQFSIATRQIADLGEQTGSE
jgi:predicted dinucleotide-binding enzyme